MAKKIIAAVQQLLVSDGGLVADMPDVWGKR